MSGYGSFAEFVASYARGPSTTTVDRAVATHEGVRKVLGDVDYQTFLQGSYKNDTALWDMNDVDIVALSRGLTSCQFTGRVATNPVTWDAIFSRIEQRLQSDARYQGKWKREDKCIRLNMGTKIDIVPAVQIESVDADPIAIFSFRAGQERKNSPRRHYDEAIAKSRATNGAFKQLVRLYKRWARCWFGSRKVAPSYYLECLVYNQHNSSFTGNVAQDFVSTATSVAQLRHGYSAIRRLAGDGNLLSSEEWGVSEFNEFQGTLARVLAHAQYAVRFDDKSYWVVAFNGQQP